MALLSTDGRGSGQDQDNQDTVVMAWTWVICPRAACNSYHVFKSCLQLQQTHHYLTEGQHVNRCLKVLQEWDKVDLDASQHAPRHVLQHT